MKDKQKKTLYRVKFQSKDDKSPLEVVVSSIHSSDFLGLIKLSNFIFNENKKHIVMPSENEARKRFAKINSLHLPYHNILSIEEFEEDKTDLDKLPFIKKVPKDFKSSSSTL